MGGLLGVGEEFGGGGEVVGEGGGLEEMAPMAVALVREQVVPERLEAGERLWLLLEEVGEALMEGEEELSELVVGGGLASEQSWEEWVGEESASEHEGVAVGVWGVWGDDVAVVDEGRLRAEELPEAGEGVVVGGAGVLLCGGARMERDVA